MNRKILSGIVAVLMIFSIAQADAIWTAPTTWNGEVINQPNQVPDNQKGLHSDPRWQMLGKQWGVNDGIGVLVNGQEVNLVNGILEINVGDEVTFDFTVHKTLWGVHTFDALKVWLDDEVIFADEWVFGETLKSKRHDKNHDTYSEYSDYTDAYRYEYKKWSRSGLVTKTKCAYNQGEVPNGGKKLESLYYANADSTFSATYTFDDAGEFDLVARVVCSRDLAGSHPGLKSEDYRNDRSVFGKDTQYTQGETERLRIRVTNVPEPSTLILLGLSMFGVAFMRQKRK